MRGDTNRSTSEFAHGDFNLDVSGGPAATSISRDGFQDAFANWHAPTTPGSFLEHDEVSGLDFYAETHPHGQPKVHRSVSASDHYPLSVNLAFD